MFPYSYIHDALLIGILKVDLGEKVVNLHSGASGTYVGFALAGPPWFSTGLLPQSKTKHTGLTKLPLGASVCVGVCDWLRSRKWWCSAEAGG